MCKEIFINILVIYKISEISGKLLKKYLRNTQGITKENYEKNWQ
jgi:hypothetical protein